MFLVSACTILLVLCSLKILVDLWFLLGMIFVDPKEPQSLISKLFAPGAYGIFTDCFLVSLFITIRRRLIGNYQMEYERVKNDVTERRQ